jgi:hypothetical protein
VKGMARRGADLRSSNRKMQRSRKASNDGQQSMIGANHLDAVAGIGTSYIGDTGEQCSPPLILGRQNMAPPFAWFPRELEICFGSNRAFVSLADTVA